MKAQEAKKTLPVFTVLERAVLYSRTSGDDSKNATSSHEGQLEMCQQYAQQKGYRVVAELSEDPKGASGYEFDLPQISKAIDMAYDGTYEVLVVRDIKRFARNAEKATVLEYQLRKHGVRVEYVEGDYSDDISGKIRKTIDALIAEIDRDDIKRRLHRGRRRSVQAGNVIIAARPPYGYRLVERDGRKRIEIIEQEARIVQLIFKWYVEGDETGKRLSAYGIARKLTEMGVKTPNDGRKSAKRRDVGDWAVTTINGILKNETYAGLWHYGKRNNRTRQLNPQDHLIAIEVDPIIPRKLWKAAQEKLATSKQDAKRNTKHEYLFGRRCTCGDCGYSMKGLSSYNKKSVLLYYGCPAGHHREYKRKCNNPYFRAKHVDDTVWNWLESIFRDEDALERSLAQYQAEREKINAPLKERLDILEALIAQHNAELTELQHSLKVLEGRNSPRTKATLVDDIEQVEKILDDYEVQRTRLVHQLEAQSLTPEQIKGIKEYAAEMVKDLDEIGDDFESRRRMIELLEVRIILLVADGCKWVDVECRLVIKPERLPIVNSTINNM